MEDFGGIIRTREPRGSRRKIPRGRLILGGVFLLVIVVLLIRFGFSGQEDSGSKDKEKEEAQVTVPALDPKNTADKLYVGSPWERRNNLLGELVKILESPLPAYQKREQAMNFTLMVKKSMIETCTEIQGNLQTDPSLWAPAAVYGERIRQDLSQRLKDALIMLSEEGPHRLEDLELIFICK